MTTRTTSCPHCSAKFFITVEQLEQRGGKARCGVCKEIFQADEHLEVTPKPRANDLTTDVPITNPSYAKLVALQAQDSEKKECESLVESNQHQEKIMKIDNQLIDDDADLGLFDDSIEENQKISDKIDTSAIFGTDISDDFKSTINMPVVKDEPFANIDTSETVQAVSDEQWLEELLSDEEPVEEFKKTKEEESEDLIGFLEDIGAHTAQFSTVSAQSIQNQGNNGSELPQPLKIPTATKNKSSFSVGRFLSVTLWSLLSILMLAILAGQYLYFNFDTLSRSMAGREKLALVCEHIECNLPNINADKIAFDEISISALNDKSILTFVIKNQNNSTTLFPAIKISMLKGDKEVGSNVVLPPDYLTANHKKLNSIQPIDGKVLIHMDKSKFDNIKLVALY